MTAFLARHWGDLSSLVGLGFIFTGALMTAWPMRVTPEEAGRVAVARIASDNEGEWAKMPAAVALLRNSRGAMRGLFLIALGSLLQAVPLIAGLFG